GFSRDWSSDVCSSDLVASGRRRWPRLTDPSRSPEDAAIDADWTRQVRHLREHCLKGGDRELLDLRLQDLTDKEIAVALDRTHGAIRVAQHRMLKRLRDCLALEREAAHDAPQTVPARLRSFELLAGACPPGPRRGARAPGAAGRAVRHRGERTGPCRPPAA